MPSWGRKKKEWNIDTRGNYVWCTTSSSILNINSFICSDTSTDKGQGKPDMATSVWTFKKCLRKNYSVSFYYTWLCICFQHSSLLLWWNSLQSNCIVPVSQIIALWLLWFRGALPSFQVSFSQRNKCDMLNMNPTLFQTSLLLKWLDFWYWADGFSFQQENDTPSV